MTKRNDPVPWLDALAGSHDRLCDIVGGLSSEGLRQPSYCDGWTIAQVLSHLGSGAQIFQGILDAVVAGETPPERDSYPAIWDRWNAMTPDEQAEGFVSTDGSLVESLEHLGDRLEELEFPMFGSLRLDAAGFLGMRLSEHALHAWDVAVALDRSATVDADAVALLVDRLPQIAHHAGHADAAGDHRPLEMEVRTSAPERAFTLRVDDTVALAADVPGGNAVTTALHMPAEAFVRLVYGRLDPSHSPNIGYHDQVELLARVFPGF